MEAPSVGTHSLVLYINHTFIVDCSPKNSKLKIFQLGTLVNEPDPETKKRQGYTSLRLPGELSKISAQCLPHVYHLYLSYAQWRFWV